MNLRVEITKEAKENLIEIGDYISIDSTTAVLSVIDSLEQLCMSLSVLPERGSLYGYQHRRLIAGRYQIVYRIDRTTDNPVVYIVAIHHTAQDIESNDY